MYFKQSVILTICVIFGLLCAACSPAPSTPDPTASVHFEAQTPEVTVTPVITLEPELPMDEAESRPAATKIPVSREGEVEHLPAYLQTGSMGYTIYLFEDFIMSFADDGDVIHPSAGSLLLDTFSVHIVRSDGQSALPQNNESEGLMIEYHRITDGAYTFDVTLYYPIEAADGGAVLLHAMMDTLKAEHYE